MKKEDIPTYFGNLRREFTRPHTVQRDEFVALSCAIPGKMRVVSMPCERGTRAIYFERADAVACYGGITRGMVKNYDHYVKIYKTAVKILHSSSWAVKKSVKSSDKARAISFKRWQRASVGFYIPVVAPFAVEYMLDGRCRKLLKEQFGEGAEEFFSIISSPTKINAYQKMRLKIDNLAISGKINVKEIAKLTSKYSWYGEYSYVEPLFDAKYFQQELAKLTKQKATNEKKHILGDKQKNRKNFSVLKKKIKDQSLKIIAEILNDYTFLRTDRVENLKLAQTRIRPLFKFIEDELNKITKKEWNHFDVANFTYQEVISFLEKRKIPDREEIKKRVNHNYVYYFDKTAHFIYEPKLIKKAQEMVRKSEEKDQEIKGLVAFKGMVRGKVAMVTSKTDLCKVKNGMILVARTTMPDYTYVMKKASAFVTEEGGITSHAAIIARELKKPCIVGTGNCTRVLKDGNLVEVDANKGIVTIIK